MRFTSILFTAFLFGLGPIGLNIEKISAQSPGGVPNPIIWEMDFGQDDSDEHGYELFNFHPYRFFTAQGDSFSLPTTGLKKMSFFIVFSSLNETEISRINTGQTEAYLTDSAMISGDTLFYPPTYQRPKFISFIETFPYRRSPPGMDPLFRVGSDPDGQEWFEGGISEVILYDRYLDEMQRNKVESYLALKYGISLPDSSDYFRSDGIPIWTAEDHPVYIHRVTGLGRDDGSLLYQKQSHNLYGDVGLTIGFNEIAQTNTTNSSTIGDQAFILWADDNDSLTFEPMDTSATLPARMERSWEIMVLDTTLRSIPLFIQLDSSAVNMVLDSSMALWLVQLANPAWPFDHIDATYTLMEPDSTGNYSCLILPDGDNSGSDLFSFVVGPTFLMAIHSDTITCGETYGSIKVDLSSMPTGRKDISLHRLGYAGTTARTTNKGNIQFDQLAAGMYELRLKSPPYGTLSKMVSIQQKQCPEPDNKNNDGFIFPNPVSTNYDFTISLKEWEVEELMISILYADGRTLRYDKVNRSITEIYKSRISEAGNYVIVISGKEVTRQYKLVVQK